MISANDVNDVEQCPLYPMVKTEAQIVCGPPITRRETVNIQYVDWIFTTEFSGEFCLHCVNPFSNELHRPIISVRILIEFCCSAIPYCPLALFTDNIYLYKSLYSYIK